MPNYDPAPSGSLAAQAWQAWARGHVAGARALARAAQAAVQQRPRNERQQAQIVALAVTGDLDRASGLASEHLAEFPGDELIGQVQTWTAGQRGT